MYCLQWLKLRCFSINVFSQWSTVLFAICSIFCCFEKWRHRGPGGKFCQGQRDFSRLPCSKVVVSSTHLILPDQSLFNELVYEYSAYWLSHDLALENNVKKAWAHAWFNLYDNEVIVLIFLRIICSYAIKLHKKLIWRKIKTPAVN